MTPERLEWIRAGLKDWTFCSRDQPVIRDLLDEIDRLVAVLHRYNIGATPEEEAERLEARRRALTAAIEEDPQSWLEGEFLVGRPRR